jgi:hypothetical protein
VNATPSSPMSNGLPTRIFRALDIDTQMPGADSGAKNDYERAVLGYDAANRRLGAARTFQDLQGLGEQLEDARFAMESAKARLAGQPAPRTAPTVLLRSPARAVDHRGRLGAPGRGVTHGPGVRRMRHRHRR